MRLEPRPKETTLGWIRLFKKKTNIREGYVTTERKKGIIKGSETTENMGMIKKWVYMTSERKTTFKNCSFPVPLFRRQNPPD